MHIYVQLICSALIYIKFKSILYIYYILSFGTPFTTQKTWKYIYLKTTCRGDEKDKRGSQSSKAPLEDTYLNYHPSLLQSLLGSPRWFCWIWWGRSGSWWWTWGWSIRLLHRHRCVHFLETSQSFPGSLSQREMWKTTLYLFYMFWNAS